MSDLTIRDAGEKMRNLLHKWYPGEDPDVLAAKCGGKTIEEQNEWRNAIGTPEEGPEAADAILALFARCAMKGIDLQTEIERKLAILASRDDQPERDKDRGIG